MKLFEAVASKRQLSLILLLLALVFVSCERNSTPSNLTANTTGRYHVGSSEDLRHPMIEAPITSFPVRATQPEVKELGQMAFFERPVAVM